MEKNEIKVLEGIFGSIDTGLKIVLIEGEEGSGKTEILKIFSNKINGDAICLYFNLNEFQGDLISSLSDSLLNNLKKILGADRFGIVKSIGKNMNEIEKFLLFVSNISSLKNTVLMFDNVENAPSSFFNIIMYMGRNLIDRKLMVILTYNTFNLSSSLKEFLIRSGELSENVLKSIKLEPLTLDGVKDLMDELGYHLPKYLIEKIYLSSKGNFKKIMDILDYLKFNGLIDEYGYWIGTFEDVPTIELQSVKTYFYSIYSNLVEREKRFLTSCSVIGEKFSIPEIKALENINDDELFNILDKLIMLRILEEAEDESFRFKKPEFYHLLYDYEISDLRKRFLHKKLAEYYEKINDDPYKIGLHFYYAKEMKKATEYLEIAAMRAYEMNRYKEAIEIFKKICQISNIEKYALIVGECYFKIGDLRNARTYYEKAMKTDKINALIRIAELEYTLGNLVEAEKIIYDLEKEKLSKDQMFYINYLKGAINITRYKFNDAIKFYDDALKIALELKNDNILGLIYKQIGIMHFYKGEFDLSEEMYKKSLEYYSRASNYDGIARIYNNLALIYTEKDFEKTVEYYELSLSYANLSGNITLLTTLNYNLSQINFWNSKIRDAERNIMVAEKLSELVKDFYTKHLIFSFLSDMETIKGNFSKALDYIEKAIETVERMDAIFISLWYKLKKFKILFIMDGGGRSISEDSINSIINAMKELNPELFESYALGELGKIYIYTGKIDEGIKLLLDSEKKAKKVLTFVDYADILGEIPFAYVLKKDYVNFKSSVEEIRDFSKSFKRDLLHLKAYLPVISEDESFKENEDFLRSSGLKFLLLKMYISHYEFKKNCDLKNKILELSNDMGLKLENFYKLN